MTIAARIKDNYVPTCALDHRQSERKTELGALEEAYRDLGTWNSTSGALARRLVESDASVKWLVHRAAKEKHLDTLEAIAALLSGASQRGVSAMLSIAESDAPAPVRHVFLHALTEARTKHLMPLYSRLTALIAKLRVSADEDDQDLARELTGVLSTTARANTANRP